MARFWLILGFIIILAGLATWLVVSETVVLPFNPSTSPTVSIVYPKSAVSVYSGQGVNLAVFVTSDNGLQRVELSLNGQPIETNTISNTGQVEQTVQFVWFSSQVGRQSLSVTAFNQDGVPGHAAVLIVDVFPRQAAAIDGFASNQDFAVAPEISVAIDAVNAQSPDEGQVEPFEQGQNEGVVAPAEPALPQNPAPEPAAPNDTPPVVRAFDFGLNVVGDEVVATLSVAAEDDIGLERVEFQLWPNVGDPILFTQHCGGRINCEAGGEAVLSPGDWLIGAQAFDISGQASLPEIRLAEVIGGPAQPPAAADHDFDFDPMADLQLEFPAGRGEFGQGFDLQDFLAGRFGNQANDPVESQGNCANLSLTASSTTIEVQGTVTCDIQTDGDHFLFAQVGQTILHQGDGGRSLSFPDWFDSERRRIPSGTAFSSRITGLQCGAEYEFSFRVDNATILEGGQQDGHIGTGMNFAYASQVVTMAACNQASIADINLQLARSGENALEATWRVAPNGNWPDRISEEGVTFYLMRYQEAADELEVVDRVDLTREELLGGREFSLLDDRLECSMPYWYSVVVHLANQQQPRFVTPIIQPSVFSEGIPCQSGNLSSIDLNISRHRTPRGDEYFLAEALFPAGFPWPQGDDIDLRMQVLHVGEGWVGRGVLDITDRVRGGDYAFEQRFDPRCGSEKYQIRLVLFQGAVEMDFGDIVELTSEPCAPSPPDLLSLLGRSGAGCPGNAPHCVVITWEEFVEPLREGYAAEGAYIIIERHRNGGEDTRWRLELGQTSFTDRNPTRRLENGACLVPTMYRIFVYDANDRTSGASPLSILEPLSCDQTWNFLIERRR
jgi:hypothetical protein